MTSRKDRTIASFYEAYPTFDWKFYQRIYADIPIRHEKDAIQHFMNHGVHEHRKYAPLPQKVESDSTPTPVDVSHLFHQSQLCISSSLSQFHHMFQKKFQTIPYSDTTQPCIFFGIYTNEDIEHIYRHEGLRLLVWGGEDIHPHNAFAHDTIRCLSSLHHCIHIAISDSIYHSLRSFHIKGIRIAFNLVDPSLFFPLERPPSTKSSSIYIYNGHAPGREHLYGQSVYTQVMKCLPQYHYVLSTTLQLPHEEMPSIYSQCFIALRLTRHHDGNANTVQECEAMKIPVIHNHSTYGLKWTTVEDVIRLIQDSDLQQETTT